MKLTELFDKRYLGRIALMLLTGAAALGLIFYVGYHVVDRFSPGLELLDALPTTVTRTIAADAYILRDEEPLYASGVSAGSAAPAIADGGRVPMHARIADVYAGTSPDVEKRLAEIDEQITLLEKNRADNRSVQSTSGLDTEIYDSVFAIRSHSAGGDYADALSLRTSLLVDIKKRGILTGEITDYSAQIRLLEQEKSELRASLGASLQSVYASSTGYYFSEYDGYGEIFSADLVDTMTFDQFMTMTAAEPVFASGVSVGTMVHDFNWYIACPMEKTEAAALLELYDCTVTFDYSGISLDMELYRVISETPGDRAVVVFRCGKMPQGFDYTRMQNTPDTRFPLPLSVWSAVLKACTCSMKSPLRSGACILSMKKTAGLSVRASRNPQTAKIRSLPMIRCSRGFSRTT